jgi:hypothetical protein
MLRGWATRPFINIYIYFSTTCQSSPSRSFLLIIRLLRRRILRGWATRPINSLFLKTARKGYLSSGKKSNTILPHSDEDFENFVGSMFELEKGRGRGALVLQFTVPITIICAECSARMVPVERLEPTQ